LTRVTLFTGTVRANRGVPQILRDLQLPAPGHAFARKGDLLVAKVSDRRASGVKILYLLDSAAASASVQVCERIRARGEREHVVKPVSVLEYNTSMGGVDRNDASCQSYSADRKTQKWFMRLARFFILQLIRNSWIAYCHLGGSKTLLKYLETCIKMLIKDTGRGRLRTTHCGQAAAAAAHFPQKLPATEAQPRPTKRCRICYRAGSRKMTVYQCQQCEGQPGLCLHPCFTQWHERQ
jgi:hypothetical protein